MLSFRIASGVSEMKLFSFFFLAQIQVNNQRLKIAQNAYSANCHK